ncbi:hypothetical protein BGZ80_002738 [Entomortierella chlamydospora]|uniref:Uncharacterized protein n=1 Tax=Entomortierella chlamydospora TaxID=101097 RepID=A0A9P6T371_9FUNG|nr:hypothetical protein BGZ79_000665 [Entomortierella chlamydospora]KAG0021269.1 hypothetical protein BGZ80_002738 [Entomortierella chlamydospora]
MMAAQNSFNNTPHQAISRAYSASSSDSTHRRAKSYDPNTFGDRSATDDESNSIPLTATHYAGSGANPHKLQNQTGVAGTPVNGARIGRSRSLFRRPSRHQHGQVFTQGTVPPVPQVPILQHTGKAASRLLRLDDPILVRIAMNFDINQLIEFSHLSKRCRAIAAKTLTIILQRTVLKATLCQERKAVFSLEFIFQHLDPASLQAVFRATQLKSRRYFENSALASPVIQALTLVTPNGSHHPIFRLAGFEAPRNGYESMTERDLERATTLLNRPFELAIKDKGFYRVSPTTSCMVDTPFFPSQPLLDPLVPIVMEGALHGPPSWEMIYKVDLLPPNYPQRVQQQQEKIYQERVRQAALRGEQPPPPLSIPPSRAAGSPLSPVTSPTGFVPLPAIKSGPNLRSILPESSPLSDSKPSKLQRKPTVVRPPPEGWGPLPPIAPPPAVPVSLAYQLGTRTVNTGGDPMSPSTVASPMSPTNAAPSCLEPELAEETERFLTLLFIQFPIQTLFPLTASQAGRKPSNGGGGDGITRWMSMSKLGRSLTLKKTHRAGESVDIGRQNASYTPLDH